MLNRSPAYPPRPSRRHRGSSSPTPPSTAPAAGFGDEDFYPDIYDKAAVLTCRLAWNHPLPDGNKRAAWASLVLFIDLNDGRWEPGPPNVDEAETAMVAVATGEGDEAWVAAWLRDRVVFGS